MPDFTMLVLVHIDDGGLQPRATGGHRGELAGVVRLPSAGGIEGSAIEGDLPQRFAAGPRVFADVGYRGGEMRKCCVSIVEALGWHRRYFRRSGDAISLPLAMDWHCSMSAIVPQPIRSSYLCGSSRMGWGCLTSPSA